MSPNSSVPPEAVTRRDFARLIAATAAAVTAASTSPGDEPKPAEPVSVAKAAEAIVRRRFGQHLSDEQVERVTQRVAAALQSSGYRKWPLQNSDEPAFVFSADV